MSLAHIRPHWSYSALNQYLRCPLQYYFERVLKLPKAKVASGLVFGSAVHDALAVFHIGIQRDEEPDWQQLQQAFLETWIDREDRQEVEYRPGESRDDLIEQGLALVRLYVEEEAPTEIVAVEQEYWVPLQASDGEYLEKPLLAKIDLLTYDRGTLTIREIKTSSRAYGESEVDLSYQATCYVNAVVESLGQWPKVEYTVLVKTKTPKIQTVKTTRSQDDLHRLGDLASRVEEAVRHEIFYPIESPINCSACPFRIPCRQWKPGAPAETELVPLMTNGVAKC